jgi:hypothetical protein
MLRQSGPIIGENALRKKAVETIGLKLFYKLLSTVNKKCYNVYYA